MNAEYASVQKFMEPRLYVSLTLHYIIQLKGISECLFFGHEMKVMSIACVSALWMADNTRICIEHRTQNDGRYLQSGGHRYLVGVTDRHDTRRGSVFAKANVCHWRKDHLPSQSRLI